MTNSSLRQRVVVGGKKSSCKIHLKLKKKISSDETKEVTKNSIIEYIFIVVPPMLNYDSLKQETEYLMQNVTLYDVCFGQKLNMSCNGDGRPTAIFDAHIGTTSDSWTRGQLKLGQVRSATKIPRRFWGGPLKLDP